MPRSGSASAASTRPPSRYWSSTGPGAHNWIYEQTVGAELAKHRTLVLHEQRGCGRATPKPERPTRWKGFSPNIHVVPDLLEAPRVDLLGWSFGADLVARVALERPDRAHRLVLQASGLDFEVRIGGSANMSKGST